jgi:hypothetical protein
LLDNLPAAGHEDYKRGPSQTLLEPSCAAGFDNNLTTTPVDVRGCGDTQRTTRRIQLPVRLHGSVGKAADI